MSDPTKLPPKDQAKLDEHLRNVATRAQAKERRLNGEARGGKGHVTLDQLPLFADELSLSEAVLGRGKYTHWRAVVPLLERRGFPKIDGLMGGRYTPALRAFFDREYRVHGEAQFSKPHSPAKLGTYSGRRKANVGP
jgi:hypothetical protein